MQEHRALEVHLDGLSKAIARGVVDSDAFRRLASLITQHYSREDQLLCALQAASPKVAAKLRSQHEEALEIATRLEECFATGETGDVIYLARRFVAIAQHNIIEEERDVFPLVTVPRPAVGCDSA